MARDGVQTYVRKFLAAIGMFAATILVFGFFIFLLSSTFGPILHEATIGFFYLGPPIGIICALYLAVCGWKGELSLQSFITTGLLVLAYLISLYLIANFSRVLNMPIL